MPTDFGELVQRATVHPPWKQPPTTIPTEKKGGVMPTDFGEQIALGMNWPRKKRREWSRSLFEVGLIWLMSIFIGVAAGMTLARLA